MTWYAWLIIGLLVLNVALTFAAIGKSRGPVTLVVALVVIIVNSLVTWGILSLGDAL